MANSKAFYVEFTCKNSAFEEDPVAETTKLLEEIIRKIRTDGVNYFPRNIFDTNGNFVGNFGFE